MLMDNKLVIYNTLTRTKEQFVPLHAPHVGMYVCGPTVYGDAHLGHARPAITFDILFRYLTHLGYKVRYVRNITDVGHLEHDADDGDFLASYFVLFSNQLLFVQERIDFLCGRVDDRADTLARAQEGARRERPAIDRGI